MPTFEERLEIPVEQEAIAGTMVTPGTLVPGVLFIHGWGGNQQQYLIRARDVATLGCICLTFDLRGHAATQQQFGTVSRETNLRDVLAAYDILVAHRHVDPPAVAVVGSSYGGYLGAILTTMRSVRWLGLRAPALYIDAGWSSPKLQLHKDHDLQAYRRQLIPVADNRALQACHAFGGDVLLIESEFDDIVPQTVLSSYREACRQARSLTYRCIAAADHGLTKEQDQLAYTSLLVTWLKEMLAGTRATLAGATVASNVAEPPESPPREIHEH